MPSVHRQFEISHGGLKLNDAIACLKEVAHRFREEYRHLLTDFQEDWGSQPIQLVAKIELLTITMDILVRPAHYVFDVNFPWSQRNRFPSFQEELERWVGEAVARKIMVQAQAKTDTV